MLGLGVQVVAQECTDPPPCVLALVRGAESVKGVGPAFDCDKLSCDAMARQFLCRRC